MLEIFGTADVLELEHQWNALMSSNKFVQWYIHDLSQGLLGVGGIEASSVVIQGPYNLIHFFSQLP